MGTGKECMTVAIVGGGLGGICAAIALGRAGYDGKHTPRKILPSIELALVHVFEQAASCVYPEPFGRSLG